MIGKVLIPKQFEKSDVVDFLQKQGVNRDQAAESSESSGKTFQELIRDGIAEVDNLQKTADKKAVDIAAGKEPNLHEAMLALTEAELNFNLMVQVRNRALEAYQEILRMPV